MNNIEANLDKIVVTLEVHTKLLEDMLFELKLFLRSSK